MNNQENIKNELKELNSSLSAVGSEATYMVPPGYFDGLAASILAKIYIADQPSAQEIETESHLLAGISKKMPYSVPSSYFADTINNLSVLIEDEPSMLLQKVGRKMPFTVPENYFEQWPAFILTQVKPKAKIMSIASRWFKYAVAAAIGGIIFISGYQYYSGKDLHSLAGTTVASDSATNTAYNETKVFTDLKKLNSQTLNEFISTVEPASIKNADPEQVATSAKEVRHLLQDVSDKEMESFLNQFSNAEDDLATTN